MSFQPDRVVVDAWIALLRAQDNSLGLVEDSFKNRGLPSFPWYDVLWELEKIGRAGIRPFELQQTLLIKQYALSRRLSRLEKAGYLTKAPCTEDGRGYRVTITKAGREIRRKMWTVYSRAIQSTIGDKLTKAQCHALAKLLSPLCK